MDKLRTATEFAQKLTDNGITLHRRHLSSFLNLFKLMKQQKMMGEQDIVDILKFGKELPHLKDQFELIVDEINSLEYKKYSKSCFVCSAKSNQCSKALIENLSIWMIRYKI